MLVLCFFNKNIFIVSDFVVSARKYRPSSFDDVVGQLSVTETLKNAIKNNQLAHSFLFCGPRGVGKTTCARIFAKEINQFNIEDNVDDFSFNIFELDAASNNSVEDIRNLTDQVRIPPQMGKYKVYIIDEVHMLSSQAFNAFLKTLEEPPVHAKFILATTEKHKIIPTILSRCQIFDFKRVTISDISDHLSFVAKNEGIIAEKEALNLIAEKSDGSMRDALSLFDRLVSFSNKELNYKQTIEHLNVLDYNYYFRITDALLNNDISLLLNLFNEILNNGFDGQHFIMGLSSHLRDVLVVKDKTTIALFEKGDKLQDMYIEQSKLCEIDFLIQALDLCNECDIQYKTSNNKRLLVELCLMRVSSIGKDDTEKKKPKTFVVGLNKKEEKTVVEKIENNDFSNSSFNNEDEVNNTDESSTKIEEIEDRVGKISLDSNNTSKMISISGALSNISNASSDQEIESQQLRKNDFSELEMHNVWNEMISFVKDKGKLNLEIILSSFTPKLKSNFLIEFPLSNSSQLEILLEEKYMLLDFMKDKLNNDIIDIKTVIVEVKKDAIAYTNKDKFKKMLEKNPHLVTLQQKIGLDPDY